MKEFFQAILLAYESYEETAAKARSLPNPFNSLNATQTFINIINENGIISQVKDASTNDMENLSIVGIFLVQSQEDEIISALYQYS